MKRQLKQALSVALLGVVAVGGFGSVDASAHQKQGLKGVEIKEGKETKEKKQTPVSDRKEIPPLIDRLKAQAASEKLIAQGLLKSYQDLKTQVTDEKLVKLFEKNIRILESYLAKSDAMIAKLDAKVAAGEKISYGDLRSFEEHVLLKETYKKLGSDDKAKPEKPSQKKGPVPSK